MNKTAALIQAIGTLLIGLALITGVVIGSSAIQNGGQGRTLTVTGTASRDSKPNQSVLSGTWEEKASSSDEARNKARQSAGKGLEAVKAKGIDEKNITTTQVSVYPEYDYSVVASGRPKITGYRAATSLEIKLDDTAKADLSAEVSTKADEIIGVMTSNGASSTSGPSLGFTTATKETLKKQLTLEATTNASGQAKALAKQSGARLGKVVSLNENGLQEPGVFMPMALESKAVSSDQAAPTDISVGDKELTATVTITYQLR